MLLLRSDDMPPGLGRRLLEDRPLRLPVLALLGGGREDSPAPAAAEDVRVAIQGTALTFAFGSAMNWYFASTREAKQPIGTSCQRRGCDSDNAPTRLHAATAARAVPKKCPAGDVAGTNTTRRPIALQLSHAAGTTHGTERCTAALRSGDAVSHWRPSFLHARVSYDCSRGSPKLRATTHGRVCNATLKTGVIINDKSMFDTRH